MAKNQTASILICLGAIFLYVLILLYLPAPFLGLNWRYDYVVIPILFSFLFYKTRNIDEEICGALLFAATLSICGVFLSETWRLEISTGSFLFGKLPYSDAICYLEGALRILNGESLTIWTSRRPLATSWLALNLFLTRENLQGALALMVFFCSMAIACISRQIRRDLGAKSAWVAQMLLLFFYRPFAGTTLSEQAGFFFGCMGFVLLWRGVTLPPKRISLSFLVGLFALAIGIIARAGTFFVLPVLAIWYALWCGQNLRRSPKFFCIAMLVLLMAFMGNRLILHAAGHPDASFGNFSYTLYGLVHGGDWRQVVQERPEILQLSEIEGNKRIYSLAFQRIQEQPSSLAMGILRAYRYFFFSRQGAYSFILPGSQFGEVKHFYDLLKESEEPIVLFFSSPIQWVVYQVAFAFIWLLFFSIAALAGVVFLLRGRKIYKTFILCAWLGIALSIPFLPPWDASLMRVYAASIPFFTLLPALSVARKRDCSSIACRDFNFGKIVQIAMLLLGVIIIVFPVIEKVDSRRQSNAIPLPASGGEVAKVIAGSTMMRRVVMSDFDKLAEQLQDENLRMHPETDLNAYFGVAYFPGVGNTQYVYWEGEKFIPGDWIELKHIPLDKKDSIYWKKIECVKYSIK